MIAKNEDRWASFLCVASSTHTVTSVRGYILEVDPFHNLISDSIPLGEDCIFALARADGDLAPHVLVVIWSLASTMGSRHIERSRLLKVVQWRK